MTAGHRPAIPYANKVDSKEERRDPCSATEEEPDEEGWRALAKELEMPRGAFSYVGWWTRPGRKVGTGFPLCEGGATPPARFISNSLPPLSFSVVGTSTSISTPGQPLSF